MPASISDILGAIQNAVNAIYAVKTQLATTFPQATTASTATRGSVGTITFTSSQATAFLNVTTSSGFSAWVPLYPSS